MSISASLEQATIVAAVTGGEHIMGDAVAGAGKTTTVIMIARAAPTKRIVQITYNSQLKLEVRKKVKAQGITNLEIHTYHSLATTYYDRSAHTDEAMRMVIAADKPITLPKQNSNVTRPSDPIDIFIIDEAQDMMGLYCRLLWKFLRDTHSTPTFFVIGDRYQNVYAFKGADVRFLTLSPDIWHSECRLLPMTTSYRVTTPIAWFINNIMLGYERIIAPKPGPPVLYIRANLWQNATTIKILDIIKKLIGDEGYTLPGTQHTIHARHDEIFILAPSVKNNPRKAFYNKSPLARLENKLVYTAKIPCHTCQNDEAVITEDIIQGKLVLTTFHQAKGRERRVVIVYGFDSSYFAIYAPDYNPAECPNTLYVAVTRASDFLIVVENSDSSHLQFLKRVPAQGHIDSNMVVEEWHSSKNKRHTPRPKRSIFTSDYVIEKKDIGYKTPTSIGRFMHEEVAIKLRQFTDSHFTCTRPAHLDISIVPKIKTRYVPRKCLHGVIYKGRQYPCTEGCRRADYQRNMDELYEEVSDITGLAVVSMFESFHKPLGKSTVEVAVDEMDHKLFTKFCEIHPFDLDGGRGIPVILELCAIYIALTTQFISRYVQLSNMHPNRRFRWVDSVYMEMMHKELTEVMPDPSLYRFERTLHISEEYIPGVLPPTSLNGYADAVSTEPGGILWEFKCVSALRTEHFLQLMCYAWLWHIYYEPKEGPRRYVLMNLMSGEAHEIMLNCDDDWATLDALIKEIISYEPRVLDNEEFIEKYGKK